MPVVCINPLAEGPDEGEGGIGRVIRAQMQYLPQMGWQVTNDPRIADVIACHIQIPEEALKLFPDKPFVAMNHGMYWTGYDWQPWALRANRNCLDAIKAADLTTVPSQWLADIVTKHTSRAVRVIPHGVDVAEWYGDPDPSMYVVWNKTRVDAICDPAPVNALASLLPRVQFVSTYAQVTDNVRVTGRLPWLEGKRLVEQAGLYLCTTRETFGIGTLEALAAGVPVVGYDFGGQTEIRDRWEEYEGGDGPNPVMLVAPGDDKALAKVIQQALSMRPILSAMAVELAKLYPWEEAVRAYATEFEGLRVRYEVQRQEPRTSIIVPAYNLEAYLPATLDSVLAQEDKDWECIVVDDASPDRCGEIADEYARQDPRFRVLHNDTNQYLARARNTGIEAALGRYILPLDADDILPTQAVRVLADALDADRTIHAAYGNVWFVEEDGKTPSGGQHWKGHSGWPMEFDYEKQVCGQRNLLPYSTMYRRTAWQLTGGYRERCRTAEDADFWCRLSQYGFTPRMVTLGDTLIYRNREGSMSRVEGTRNWSRWFPGSRDPQSSPAGSNAEANPPVAALDPPGVTVVIPVGPGHERIVMDAIDSVEAQTYRGFECIVVNDSGKSLGNVPAWVKVISSHKTGGGTARARNMGIRHARAALYLALDADDLLQPTALEEFLRASHLSGPKSVIYSDVYQERAAGTTIFRYYDFDPLRLQQGCIHTVTALTPVAAWREVGGYPEDVPVWEDWAFQLKTTLAGWCPRRLMYPLFTYRIEKGFRREENVARKDAMATFGRHYERELRKESLTMCGCNKNASLVARGVNASLPKIGDAPGDGMTLMQYVGTESGNFVKRGRVTGQTYYFNTGKLQYVFTADVAYLLAQEGFMEAGSVDGVPPSPVPTLVSERVPA
jgi:glycosyltransferase involved in cell wall biosynthesis